MARGKKDPAAGAANLVTVLILCDAHVEGRSLKAGTLLECGAQMAADLCSKGEADQAEAAVSAALQDGAVITTYGED